MAISIHRRNYDCEAFEESPVAIQASWSLTTLHQDPVELGSTAARPQWEVQRLRRLGVDAG